MMLSEHLNRCESLLDIQTNTGKRVLIVGVYMQIDARMRKKGEPVYSGNVVVQMRDGTAVMLEMSWSSAAVRGADERLLFNGNQVEVTGIVHLKTPEPPEDVNYVMGPCVSPVERVELYQNNNGLPEITPLTQPRRK